MPLARLNSAGKIKAEDPLLGFTLFFRDLRRPRWWWCCCAESDPMSARDSDNLMDNENGGSEIVENNDGETDHPKLGASQQQMSGERPNGSQHNESRGPEVLYTNGDSRARELGPLPQQRTGEQPNGSQDNEIIASAVSTPTSNNIEENSQDGHPDYDADVEFLDLSSASMELKESQKLARAMERGELKKLKILVLEDNHGDLGMRAMLNALRRHHLEGLQKLFLWDVSSYDQLTVAEEGTEVIADALRECALPNVEVMDLRGCLPKLQHSRTRFEALKSLFMKCTLGDGKLRESSRVCLGCLVCNTGTGAIQTLECLRCLVGSLPVYSGDTGIQKLGRAFKECPCKSLKELYLQQNYIGDKGASDLAKTLRRGVLPSLERLDLQNNPVGKEGAENIIFAFLRNPLLTTRVHMEWPNRLQRQRYVAFRESNIRLEVRLKSPNLGIGSSQVVINEFDYPEYTLRRPRAQSGNESKGHPHRLRLVCQAHAENRKSFEDHEVNADHNGIEFRVLSIFTPSPPTYVDREPEESVAYSGPMKDDKSGDLGSAGNYPPMSGPVSSMTRSMQKKEEETVLKRSKGVNRICIKKRSLGFIFSAKAFAFDSKAGSKERRPLLGEGKKVNEAMKAIVQELLMLADRKPDEFFQLFGLRQVLLKNPALVHEEKAYSRRWICNSCFLDYQRRNQSLVFPITTGLDLELDSGRSN